MPRRARANVTGKRNGVDDADLFVAFYVAEQEIPRGGFSL